MSKASATTKATATALLSRDMIATGQVAAPVRLLWDRAIGKVRARTR
jgi:hypothetical protein